MVKANVFPHYYSNVYGKFEVGVCSLHCQYCVSDLKDLQQHYNERGVLKTSFLSKYEKQEHQ